ncbi:hypothetical protein MMC25_004523 [Agyrium rufum]|nr:hypothetical protein [Agyrium rufum]
MSAHGEFCAEESLLPKSEREHNEIIRGEEQTQIQKRRRKYTLSIVCISIACIIIGFASIYFLNRTAHEPVVSIARCKNPAVRHEWRSLSTEEKGAYVRAVQCLRTVPSRLGLNQTLYDDFPYFHARTGEDGPAHYTAAFLSWHRWFLHLYETALRQQCGYKGHLPYWDWSLDWENITLAPVWDAATGFGGNGNASDTQSFRGFCVTDGPFARLELSFIGPMDVPHCLSRNFLKGENITSYAQAIRPMALDDLLRTLRYEDFSLALERGPHLSIPFSIHGDFSVPSAPQDPVFFLHHTQLDRLWWKWQQADLRTRLYDYAGSVVSNSTTKSAGLHDMLFYGQLGPDVTVSDIMDTRAGPLCYEY